MSARLARIGNIASDGRPILGLDSRDLLEITLESEPARLSGAGAYLDAVVRGARLAIGVRFDRRVLWRPGRPHLRGRDRPLLRSADELADFVSRPLSAHLEFRRAFARQARPRGDDLRLRPRLFRDHATRWRPATAMSARSSSFPTKASITSTATANASVRLTPQETLRAWRPLPGLRRAGHDRRRASGRGAGRSQRGRGAAAARPPARSRTWCRCRRFSPRSPRSGVESQDGRAQLRSGDRHARRRAFDPAGGAGRGHRPRRLVAAGRGDHAPARRQGDPRARL